MSNEEEKDNAVMISKEMWETMKLTPFISSKLSFDFVEKNGRGIFLLRKKAEGRYERKAKRKVPVLYSLAEF